MKTETFTQKNHFYEISEKNSENWNKKVRITFINFTDDENIFEEELSKNQVDILSYYNSPQDAKKIAILKKLSLTDSNTSMLFDKNGILRYTRLPNGVSWEEKINALLLENQNIKFDPSEAEIIKSPQLKGENESKQEEISLEQLIEFFNKLEEEYIANKESLGSDFIGTHLSARKSMDTNGKFEGCAYMDGLVTRRNEKSVQAVFCRLFDGLPKSFDKYTHFQITSKYSVKYGNSCANCKTHLDLTIPHYVCTVCQIEKAPDQAFCVSCAENDIQNPPKSAKELFHPHPLAYVTEKTVVSMMNATIFYNGSKLIEDDDPEIEKFKRMKARWMVQCSFCGKKPI